MIFSDNTFYIDLDLDEPPFTEPKKYWCRFCEFDNAIEISKEDLHATITRIPSRKNNLELAFWAKCPVCGNDNLIKRFE